MTGASPGLTCQRDLFSLPSGCHYLNCAYMSPLSKRVEAAGVRGIRRKAVPARIRSSDFFSEVDQARGLFARLIGAPAAERIAIIPSASYGLANVARNTPVTAGQNVVTIDEQFPSNVHPWRRRCEEQGGELRAVGRLSGPARSAAWNEAILSAIDRDTAAVALEPVHWTDGTRFDLAAIGDRAREVGAVFVIDGTQTIGAEPFDFARLEPDAVVCAAYKWLMGPYSIGAAYFGPRFDYGVPIEDSWLTREGSDDFSSLGGQAAPYRPGAIRYDVGETSNFILMPMFIAALEQVLEWGVSSIAEYIAELTGSLFADHRITDVVASEGVPETTHLFGLNLGPDSDPSAIRDRLREQDVFVSIRGRSIRVAPHVYNDHSDIDALVDSLSR